MYLFFDTETTGFPKAIETIATQTEKWPHLVQLAWILYDLKGNVINEKEFIIKPEGFTIPGFVSEIHGITTERAMAEGVPLAGVMKDFLCDLHKATLVVAHNMGFDEKMAAVEFFRCGIADPIPDIDTFCTMQTTTGYCKLPKRSGNGYKWPKLQELHKVLFGSEFDDAHDALNDVRATARCFWELARLKVIPIHLGFDCSSITIVSSDKGLYDLIYDFLYAHYDIGKPGNKMEIAKTLGDKITLRKEV